MDEYRKRKYKRARFATFAFFGVTTKEVINDAIRKEGLSPANEQDLYEYHCAYPSAIRSFLGCLLATGEAGTKPVQYRWSEALSTVVDDTFAEDGEFGGPLQIVLAVEKRN